MPDTDEQQRYKDNLQGEVDGAAVYSALADAEKDPNLAKIYRRLASVERAHAEFWRSRLDRTAHLTPSFRARAMAFLARRLGPGFVLPVLAIAESRDSSHYDAQPEAVAGGLPADERSHARIIQAAVSRGSGGVEGRRSGAVRGAPPRSGGERASGCGLRSQ